MKNSLLNKTIFHTQKYKLNEKKYGLLEKINAPFLPIEYSIGGALGGLLLGMAKGDEGPIGRITFEFF